MSELQIGDQVQTGTAYSNVFFYLVFLCKIEHEHCRKRIPITMPYLITETSPSLSSNMLYVPVHLTRQFCIHNPIKNCTIILKPSHLCQKNFHKSNPILYRLNLFKFVILKTFLNGGIV